MSSDITYMWNLKMIQMNLYTKQEEMHRHRKQIYGYQRERGRSINKEFGINIYTLLYIKQITYKKVLYNTRTLLDIS